MMKRILIVGGANGIGLAIATEMGIQIWNVNEKKKENEVLTDFSKKIQIWDKLLKISHRFRLQNTIGND